MAFSKIIFNGTTLMDVTTDTVAANNLLSGNTATGADGQKVQGTYVPSGETINNQNKTVTPTESQQSITADSGYTGLGTVTVNAIDSNYVGSGIQRRSSLHVSPSGTSIIASSGYYPNTTSYNISSSDLQNKTVTPTKSQQSIKVDPNIGYIGLGTVTVNAIPSEYIVPTGNLAITANGTGVDVSSYATASVNVESTEFIVTLSEVNDVWTPDKTIAEIKAAYDSGKNIIVQASSDYPPEVSGHFTSGGLMGDQLAYTVSTSGNISHVVTEYVFDANNGVQEISKYASYVTDNATITAADVAEGKIAYGANGRITGTSTAITPTGTISLTSNGTHDVTQYATASVNIQPSLETTTVTPTESQQTITPSSGKDGFSEVTVNAIDSSYVGSGIPRRNSLHAAPNGNSIIAEQGYYSATTSYIISPNDLQDVTVTPTESQQTIKKDSTSGYIGLGTVTVEAISSTYVGSEVSRRSSSDLTASGSTITAPAGYYAEAASKSVASGSATTPATTITANPSISVSSTGLITATASASKSITPTVSAGYISSGTSGTVTVSGSNTEQLSVQAAATITPSETSQTAVAAGKYTTGAITVAAIPSIYVGSGIDRRDETDLTASGATVTVPAGYYAEQETKSVATATHASPTASINSTTGLVTASHTQTAGYVSAGTTTGTLQLTTQAATTITPTKSSQTAVSAGKYTTGAVTVAAIPSNYITTTDATAAAGDIVSGETAYVNGSKVTGTLQVKKYYTGTADPSTSQYNDGDIYLKVVG